MALSETVPINVLSQIASPEVICKVKKLFKHFYVFQGSIAFVPQQAWIQNMTLRDNILFAKAFVRDKYDQVLEVCALTDDLKILGGGDMTEIGERVCIVLYCIVLYCIVLYCI